MISPRSEKTEKKYQTFKNEKRASGADLSAFNLDDEIVVRAFTHWLIIENRFPYDNMTSVNHMLIPKRDVSDFSNMHDDEKNEHEEIRKTLTNEAYYDAVVENFPRSKSVTRHVHLHLVRWKFTTDEGKNISDLNT